MVLVDSSVWIDFLRGRPTPETWALANLIESGSIVTGDLILVEVLQGCLREEDYWLARSTFASLPIVSIASAEIALQAAANYRTLRRKGITVRKTIDTLIATRCIADGLALLHSDRDFLPFADHLGLQVYAPAREASGSLH